MWTVLLLACTGALGLAWPARDWQDSVFHAFGESQEAVARGGRQTQRSPYHSRLRYIPATPTFAQRTAQLRSAPSPHTTSPLNLRVQMGSSAATKNAIVNGPSAAAALAYMNVAGTSDICAVSSRAFLEAVLAGQAIPQANVLAQSAYVNAWNTGLRPVPGSACAASDAAFVRSASLGKDGVLDSALTFINAWPGVAEGNPCAISGQAFVRAVASGSSTDDADIEAATAYIDALHANPDALERNPACAAAVEAYIKASNEGDNFLATKSAPLRTPKQNSPATSEAIIFRPSALSALAYMNTVDGSDLCAISSKAFLEVVIAGKSIAAANDAASAAWIKGLRRGLSVTPGTACAASNDAFILSHQQGKDGVLDSALAFINAWPGVAQGNPCAISGQAFVRAVSSGKSTDDADVEAATAYIDALHVNPDALDRNPACAKSVEVYIKETML